MAFRRVGVAALLGVLLVGCSTVGVSTQYMPGVTPQLHVSLVIPNETTVNDTDRMFLSDVSRGNLAEIKLGQLAVAKAVNSQVKAYGQRMIKDHTSAQSALVAAAAKARLASPQDLTPEQMAAAQKLSALSGKAFDEAFMRQMMDDHNKVLMLFEKERDQGTNPAIKAVATENLPVIEDHLRLALGIMGTITRYRL